MIFTEQQIDDILRIIDFQHLMFIGKDVDADLLTEDDKNILRSFGVEPETLRQDFTPYQQAFYFGRLVASLKDQAGKVNYNDFLQYLRRGQFIPLSESERNALKVAGKKTYGHLKKLNFKVRSEVESMILEDATKNRLQYEKIIHDSAVRTVKERESVRNMVLEIGNKTKDWGRDLGRIAETELQDIFELGTAQTILDNDGEDALVYKEVYRGACRYCINLYLTNGIGSQPKVFKLKDLIKNGSNIGRKVSDWIPTISPIHPFCRCRLCRVPGDSVWSEEKKDWVEKPFERNIERKSKVHIYVGDKEFIV